MGIVIAVLMLTSLNMPFLGNWVEGSGWVDVVSLLGLIAVIVMLMRKALGKPVAGKS